MGLSFRDSIQRLQIATKLSTTMALTVGREPKALLQHATGEAAAKFGRIKAVFQKVDDLPAGRHIPGELALPDLEGHAGQSIEPDNIRARQAICYGEMVEEVTVTKLSERLVELFQNGMLSIATQGSASITEPKSFFSGRLLDADDFQGEQQYRRKKP